MIDELGQVIDVYSSGIGDSEAAAIRLTGVVETRSMCPSTATEVAHILGKTEQSAIEQCRLMVPLDRRLQTAQQHTRPAILWAWCVAPERGITC